LYEYRNQFEKIIGSARLAIDSYSLEKNNHQIDFFIDDFDIHI